MSVCCCSLAGTAACRTCPNNPNAETPPPVITYTTLPEPPKEEYCPLSPAPEQKHGRWIPEDIGTGEFLLFDCSVCGKLQDGITLYCPCCGARMDEEEG